MRRLGAPKRLDLGYRMCICIQRKKLGISLVHVHKPLATAILSFDMTPPSLRYQIDYILISGTRMLRP